MAKHKSDEPNAVIGNWMRNRNTLEYLGLWEYLNNPAFNYGEFATINQLICLSNMEKLNQIDIKQMKVLEDLRERKMLK